MVDEAGLEDLACTATPRPRLASQTCVHAHPPAPQSSYGLPDVRTARRMDCPTYALPDVCTAPRTDCPTYALPDVRTARRTHCPAAQHSCVTARSCAPSSGPLSAGTRCLSSSRALPGSLSSAPELACRQQACTGSGKLPPFPVGSEPSRRAPAAALGDAPFSGAWEP